MMPLMPQTVSGPTGWGLARGYWRFEVLRVSGVAPPGTGGYWVAWTAPAAQQSRRAARNWIGFVRMLNPLGRGWSGAKVRTGRGRVRGGVASLRARPAALVGNGFRWRLENKLSYEGTASSVAFSAP